MLRLEKNKSTNFWEGWHPFRFTGSRLRVNIRLRDFLRTEIQNSNANWKSWPQMFNIQGRWIRD
jgi:hypothetical protein